MFGAGVWDVCRFIGGLGVSDCGVIGDVSWRLMLALIVGACADQKVGEEGVTGPLIRVAVFGAGVWDMCRFIDGLLVGKNTWLEDRCMLVLLFCPLSDKGGKEEDEKEKEKEEEEEEKEEEEEEEKEEEKEEEEEEEEE